MPGGGAPPEEAGRQYQELNRHRLEHGLMNPVTVTDDMLLRLHYELHAVRGAIERLGAILAPRTEPNPATAAAADGAGQSTVVDLREQMRPARGNRR